MLEKESVESPPVNLVPPSIILGITILIVMTAFSLGLPALPFGAASILTCLYSASVLVINQKVVAGYAALPIVIVFIAASIAFGQFVF